ncbi:hypothetical protein [Gynuella sunshinyii]|uniref:Uncharacterized protein n=1 Tax=Gynuella sunshinyii YC6258 TaxID=1445510 RepID=A0A0C5VYF1_9GAMM|nr:hypothetical protein [Gynuella sunshinyii]AJQ95419.1 hypothetical Protein YC6258_03383 [Gynuella sunshinyii YC6258]
MSRVKKTRSLKNKLKIKTGSKKSFIAAGELGKIPSKNKLSKHKKRQKSAYQKFLEQEKVQDTSSGTSSPKQKNSLAAEQDAPVSKEKEVPKAKQFDQLNDDELWQQWDN